MFQRTGELYYSNFDDDRKITGKTEKVSEEKRRRKPKKIKPKATPSKIDPLALLRQIEESAMALQSDQKSTMGSEEVDDGDEEEEEGEGEEEEGESQEPKESGTGDTIAKEGDPERSDVIGKMSLYLEDKPYSIERATFLWKFLDFFFPSIFRQSRFRSTAGRETQICSNEGKIFG